MPVDDGSAKLFTPTGAGNAPQIWHTPELVIALRDPVIRRYEYKKAAIMGLCADYGRTACGEEGIHANLALVAARIADAALAEDAAHEKEAGK